MGETPGPGEEQVDPRVVEKAKEVKTTITPPDKVDPGALRRSLGNWGKKPAEAPPVQPTPPTPPAAK